MDQYFAEFKGRRVFIAKGAITTWDRYAAGVVSLAHLGKDGVVRRFNRVIGTKENVVPLEDPVPDMDMGDMLGGIMGCLSNDWSEASRPRDEDDAWFDSQPTVNPVCN